LWPAGTLCITIAANIAETAILTFDACFPDSVVGFVASEPMLVRYIEMFLRTAKQDLARYAPATAQKNINLETLEGVAVPLPPLAEQGRMIEELDRTLSIGNVVEESIAKETLHSGRLRQAILSTAFEGRLVEQDPADEPADVLLARSRAERSATAPTSSQSKRSRKLKAAP
jgi:type I restriction enzyme S subunit